MGREVKRVPAKFDWPIGKAWEGFLNPHYKPCPGKERTCFHGRSAAGAWMDAIGRFLQIVGNECVQYPHAAEQRARGMNAPHPYLTEFPQCPRPGIPPEIDEQADAIQDKRQRQLFIHEYLQSIPAYEIVPLTDELLDVLAKFADVKKSEFQKFGHTAWDFEKVILSKAGADPETWGRCPICNGEGIDPAMAEAYEAWEKTPIPDGEWWQVWETVSEGSPVTPAFEFPEQLIDYLVQKGDAWDQKRGDGGWSREAAESFVKAGWAPSLIAVGGSVYAPRDGIPEVAKKGEGP